MAKSWRDTKEYREWHKSVIERDGKCVICGSKKHLHAHHLNHASYFPDQRFDINNGVTLCSSCHMNFHNNFKRSYRTKCTKYDFENFLTLVDYLRDRLSCRKQNPFSDLKERI